MCHKILDNCKPWKVHILNKNHFWSTVYTQQIHPHIPRDTKFEWLFIRPIVFKWKSEKAFSLKGCTINDTIKLSDRGLAHEYSEVPNKSVSFLILFFWIFYYLHGLIRTYLHIYLGKSSHLHCFLRNKYKTIPSYRLLLRPTVY